MLFSNACCPTIGHILNATQRPLLPPLLDCTAAAPMCCDKSNTVNVDNGVGGGDGEGGAAAQIPDCTDAGETDPGTAGSPIVRVGSLNGQSFWVDVHEVSRSHHKPLLPHAPPSAAVPCSWEAGYALGLGEAGAEAGSAPGDVPITCVD